MFKKITFDLIIFKIITKMKIRLIILFLWSIGAVFAQKTDYKTAIESLQGITAKDYPESSTISIENQEVEINKECLGTNLNEVFTKILNEQGKQQSSQLYFGYDSDYDTLEVVLVEVIKLDGTVNKINTKEVLKKVSQSAFGGFSNIYTETGWILTGNIPNLEVGDIVHEISKNITHKAYMDNNYFNRISVEKYSTIFKSFFKLTTPKDLKINVIHINKKENLATFKEQTVGDKNIYTCSFNYIPQIIYEPGMDDNDFFSYYIMLTTVDNWEYISKWYYGLVKDHLVTDQAIKDKVAELTKDAKDDEEKMSKLFYWVAQKVRYLGVDKEKNRPGLEPHDVTYTFETRGGVCRDKAALLVAMLREAGIQSDVILISAGMQLNHKAPVMWFNHAIAISYDDKGEPLHIFDPTNETSKDFLPQYEEDNTYLIAREKGADLKIIPVSPASKNNTNISLALKIDDENNATGSIKVTYSGLADTYVRGSLMRKSPNKRKEMLQKTVSAIHPSASIIDFSISDPENKDENIMMEATFDIPNYIDKDGDQVFVPYEASKLSLSFIYNWEMEVFNLSDRNYPFKIDNTFSVDINEKINFATPISSVSVPKSIDLDYKGFKLVGTSVLSDDKKELNAKVSFSSSRIHFKKEEYKELKDKLSGLEQLEKLYIIGVAPKTINYKNDKK